MRSGIYLDASMIPVVGKQDTRYGALSGNAYAYDFYVCNDLPLVTNENHLEADDVTWWALKIMNNTLQKLRKMVLELVDEQPRDILRATINYLAESFDKKFQDVFE